MQLITKIHMLFRTKHIFTKKIESSFLFKYIPDKTALDIMFYNRFGRRIDWANPKTYNEKLQWLKLYNRNPIYTQLVDKYAVKEWVANKIGSEYIIPTLGVWDHFDDIDFDLLPEQFVLKTTHSGGMSGVVICHDKSKFDFINAKAKLTRSLNTDSYGIGREWPYKNVVPRIISEKYIHPDSFTNDLPDYKFFCFDGEVKALFVGTERQKEGTDVKFDFFDSAFNYLPLRQGHDHAEERPHKPHNFELMKSLAEKLSYGMPHVRVDFYDIDDAVLFGEMTFFHFGGFVPFEPSEWDVRFGEMIHLPLL